MVISPNQRCTEELPSHLLSLNFFESVLLSLYGSYLYSDHLQFGFKANSTFME